MSGARKTFRFGGVDSSTYNLWINGGGVFNSAEPDLEYISIPGRNGDLIYNNNRYHNIEISYSPVYCPSNFKENLKNFISAIRALKGYQMLFDDYHTGEFRMASFAEAINVRYIDWENDAGEFDLVFNCKPQIYLNSGNMVYTYSSSPITLTNPTLCIARPRICVYGAGTVTVGSMSFTITTASSSGTCVDSEMQDCYAGMNGSANLNQNVEIGDYFPTLSAGNTTITFGDGISMIQIEPRWWRL